MRRTLILLLSICLPACGTVHYVLKSGDPFSSKDLREHPELGIAVVHNQITGLYHRILCEATEFAEHPLECRDIGKEAGLTDDRMMIWNIHTLAGRYPEMRYALVVWVGESEVTRDYEKVTRSESHYNEDTEETEWVDVEYDSYETRISLPCEVLLFDLSAVKLLAKSRETFSESEVVMRKDTGSDHSWAPGTLETILDILDLVGDSAPDSDNFPVLYEIDPGVMKNYFYHFLDKADSPDFTEHYWCL